MVTPAPLAKFGSKASLLFNIPTIYLGRRDPGQKMACQPINDIQIEAVHNLQIFWKIHARDTRLNGYKSHTYLPTIDLSDGYKKNHDWS